MQSLKRFLSTSFGSAVAGGAVVLVVGLILIQAGVVNSDSGNSGPVIEPAALARPASNSSQGLTVHDIYQRDGQGVAFIRSTIVQKTQSAFGFPQQQSSEATGSGFLIDNDGHILTNAHVVEGAKSVTVQLGSGSEQNAQVVGSDPSSDIALLKVDNTEGASPLPLGDSARVQVGDPVVAIGNPFGSRPDRDERHRLGAPAADPGSQRLRDLRRDPDRRGDQPRQLRWAADQRRRPGDRHQLPDREPERR